MSARTLLLAAFANLALCGCVTYQSEPISPAANAQALDSRSLNDPRLRSFVAFAMGSDGAAARPAWDLPELTAAALYYHPDIALARAKLAEARAAVITAGQHPNPVLNFANIVGQGLVAGAIPAGAAPLTIGPVVDFIIETCGKREARTAQAQSLVDAARFDLASAGWQVRGRVRAAMLALWAAQQRLDLTRQRLALEDQLVELLEHRLAAGEASSLDVARERINRSELTLAESNLEQTAAEARVQLATAIGVPAHALDGIDLEMGAFDHPPALPLSADAGAWRRDALTKRTDIQAALQNYQAAQAALRLAVADQYPNITLSPGYTYQYGINQYELNLGTTLPIFNQNQGQIDDATMAYRRATKTLASADALLADERHRAEQMESSFRAGQVDRPTLVTAQVEAAATALSHFDAVVQQREALGRLEDALQRPLYGPDVMLSLPQMNPESGT